MLFRSPDGAKVSYKPYDQPDAPWVEAGVTPIESLRIGGGYYRWRLEREGYEPREAVEIARREAVGCKVPLSRRRLQREVANAMAVPSPAEPAHQHPAEPTVTVEKQHWPKVAREGGRRFRCRRLHSAVIHPVTGSRP